MFSMLGHTNEQNFFVSVTEASSLSCFFSPIAGIAIGVCQHADTVTLKLVLLLVFANTLTL